MSMQLSKFQETFNAYAEKTNQEFRIDKINIPEDNEDGSPGSTCSFVVTDYLSGTIYVNAGEIEMVQTIAKPIRAIDGAKAGLFNILLIDIMTDWGLKRRNKLIKKLGYINGSYVKGSAVTEGGYRFKAVRQEGTIMFSMRVGI